MQNLDLQDFHLLNNAHDVVIHKETATVQNGQIHIHDLQYNINSKTKLKK